MSKVAQATLFAPGSLPSANARGRDAAVRLENVRKKAPKQGRGSANCSCDGAELEWDRLDGTSSTRHGGAAPPAADEDVGMRDRYRSGTALPESRTNSLARKPAESAEPSKPKEARSGVPPQDF